MGVEDSGLKVKSRKSAKVHKRSTGGKWGVGEGGGAME